MIAVLTLAHLLDDCAPNVGRRTMTAIVRVESGGNPLLIRDNSLDRTFAPRDAKQGVVWANQLLKLGHSIDLGISQINNANLPLLGLSVREAFDPCINVHGGATILTSDYRAAASQFGQGQYALRRAIGAYNSGSLYGGYGYIAKILAAVGISADDDFRVPELQRIVFPPPSLRPVYAKPRPVRATIARGAAPDPYSAPILVSPNGNAAGTTTPAPRVAVPSGPASASPTGSPTIRVRYSPERSPILATPSGSSAPSPSPTPISSPAPGGPASPAAPSATALPTATSTPR